MILREYKTNGNLRLMEEKNSLLLQYKLRRPYGYFELDDFLWNNTGNKVTIKIEDDKNNILFNQRGRLWIDTADGTMKYMVNEYDLDEVLWNNVGNDLYFTFNNFIMEGDV
jgi:hypothetical protein